MPRFAFKAIEAGGALVEGEVSAATQEAAIALIRSDGVVPVEVRARSERRRGFSGEGFLQRRRANQKDLLIFLRQFAILLRAGTPADRALEVVHRTQGGAPSGALARDVLKALKAGDSLSEGMARRGDVFTPLHVGIIRAGEAGGALAPALDRLAELVERTESLRRSVRTALTYPLLVLVLTGLSLVVLMVYVVPEFTPMFQGMRGELPLSTRVVMATSDFVRSWGLVALTAVLAVAAVASRMLRREGARRRMDAILLSAPLFGDLVRRMETSRFCRTLGALLQNGVELPPALQIAASALGNSAMRAAAARASGPLARGEGIARPLAAAGAFPDMALQLLAIGEESGRLPQMLDQVAGVYEAETEAAIQRMLSLLTPVVTIGLGGLIAVIIGAILSAVLGSYNLAL